MRAGNRLTPTPTLHTLALHRCTHKTLARLGPNHSLMGKSRLETSQTVSLFAHQYHPQKVLETSMSTPRTSEGVRLSGIRRYRRKTIRFSRHTATIIPCRWTSLVQLHPKYLRPQEDLLRHKANTKMLPESLWPVLRPDLPESKPFQLCATIPRPGSTLKGRNISPTRLIRVAKPKCQNTVSLSKGEFSDVELFNYLIVAKLCSC
jgi:hypothetical protein